MTFPKFVARKLRMDAGRSRKKPPGKPSIFNVRVPTADVADFGSSIGNDGGMMAGAALGVLVVEAMVWRRWWSSSAFLALLCHNMCSNATQHER